MRAKNISKTERAKKSMSAKDMRLALVSKIGGFLILAVVSTLLLLWHYPQNVTYANFYAEDGSVFLQNILDKGWIKATLTPFNGYFIVGLYFIEALGWILNALFGGDGLLSLSAYFALAAVIFMGLIVSLPYLLFADTFGKFKMACVVLLSALLPLPTSPHVVIGTVGNQKWIFLYLAFLVTIYWLLHRGNLWWKRGTAIALVLLICAYTNSTTYLLFPILLLPYIKDLWAGRKQQGFLLGLRTLLRSREVIILVVVGLLLLPQVIYVALNGIPKIAGYLDTPYNAQRTIELFINRTYLFGITHLFNHYLNDIISVLLFLALLGGGVYFTSGKERMVFLVAVYTAGVGSLLFVANRPGVTDFVNGYSEAGSGPDQFFYAQTLIMYLPIVLLVWAVSRRLRFRWASNGLFTLFISFIAVSGIISMLDYGARWRNASVYENYAHTFIDQSIAACERKPKPTDELGVILYPYANGQFRLEAPASKICRDELQDYQQSYQDYKLVPDNNNFRVVSKGTQLTQTFVAAGPNLNGVRVFISDFGDFRREGTYVLRLFDANCKRELRRAELPTVLLDNTYYNARFNPIAESRGKTYCFTLSSPDGEHDPVAVQLSAPDVYPRGMLTENRKNLPQDLVFQSLYTQQL